jgi:(p)ppGpp synthase/HD superfamily hydrolase
MDKKIIKAINYTIKMHEDDFRKGSKIPYITHPQGVMNILLEEQAYDPSITDDVIIAGLYHDLNEDANVSITTIEENSGKEVAKLVQDVSEPEGLKKNPDKRGTWKKRKEHSLHIMTTANKYTKMLFCADKLDNIRSIHRDLITGIDVWKKFNAPYEEIKWYYESTITALKTGDSIENTRMFKLLEIEVKEVFG